MNRTLKANLVVILIFLGTIFQVKAQKSANEFIKGGISDANKLANAYLNPFGRSLGVNLNSGWYNTGQPLKTGRFELKFVVPVTFIPTSDRTFNLDDIGFNQPRTFLINGEQATESWAYSNDDAPTVFGSRQSTTLTKTLNYGSQTQQITSFDIAGIGVGVNPLPIIPQLSVGLIKGTEIQLRYLPKINMGRGSNMNYWGVGFKHSVIQWIPGLKELPFDISIAGAYSKLHIEFPNKTLPVTAGGNTGFAVPGDQGSAYTLAAADAEGVVAYNAADYDNQMFNFDVSGWNVNAIISKKLSIVTLYGGIRYSNSKATPIMSGKYGVAGEPYINSANSADPNNGKQKLYQYTDPINFDMKTGQIGINGGVRLKLAIMTIFAEGSLAKYSTVTAGIGFGFMN